MIVFSYGATKSGSTLAFEMAKAIASNAGHSQTRLSDSVVEPGHPINFINRLSKERVDALIDAVPQDKIIVVKTHSGFTPDLLPYLDELGDEGKGKVKVHVNCRDPRDICLSLVDAGVQAREKDRKAFSEIETLEQAAENVAKQLHVCLRWACIKGALLVDYNQTAFNMDKAIEQIATHLAVTCNPKEVRRIVTDVAFTQKNKAVKDRYKTELSADENKELEEQFRLFLRNVYQNQNTEFFKRRRSAILARAEELAEG